MKENPKFQIPNSRQIRNSESHIPNKARGGNAFRSLVLAVWDLFGIWDLRFGIFFLWALALGILLAGSCAPQPEPLRICPGKATVAEALQTLEMRAARAVPLRAHGQAVLTYHVPDKNRVERHNVPMQLLFAPPADIYIQGSVGVDGKAIIMGSNERDFWLALRPKEISSYYVGQWREVRDFEGLMVSPRIVLEAMGLVTEPNTVVDEKQWTLKYERPCDVVTRRDSAGRPVKRLYIYACDYSIRRIEYFDRRGKVVAVAQLRGYKPVEQGAGSSAAGGRVTEPFDVPTRIDVVATGPEGQKDSIVMEIRSATMTRINERQRQLYLNPPPADRYEHVYHWEDGGWVPE
jgi:hypothetical protein